MNKRISITRKVWAFLLALVMVVSLLPANLKAVYAAEVTNYTVNVGFYDHSGENAETGNVGFNLGDWDIYAVVTFYDRNATDNKNPIAYGYKKIDKNNEIYTKVNDQNNVNPAQFSFSISGFKYIADSSSSFVYDSDNYRPSVRLYRYKGVNPDELDYSQLTTTNETTISDNLSDSGFKYSYNSSSLPTTDTDSTTINLKKVTADEFYAVRTTGDAGPAAASAFSDGKYKLFVEVTHNNGNAYYMADFVPDGEKLVVTNWCKDDGSLKPGETYGSEFTTDGKTVLKILKMNGSTLSMTQAKNGNDCSVVESGSIINGYKITIGEAFVEEEVSVGEGEPKNIHHVQSIDLKKKTVAADYTLQDVLGDAINFGVVANTVDHLGHSETNLATKTYIRDTIDVLDPDMSYNTNGEQDPGEFYVGKIEKGEKEGIEQRLALGGNTIGNSTTVYVYDSSDKVENRNSKTANIVSATEAEINNKVNPIIDHIKSISNELAAKDANATPYFSGDKFYVDSSAMDANATIYVDIDGSTPVGQKMLTIIGQEKGVNLIKKPGQLVVFNFKNIERVEKFGKINVINGDNTYDTDNTTKAHTQNEIEADIASQQVIWNLNKVKYVQNSDDPIHTMASSGGVFLMGDPESVIEANGASCGWIASAGTVNLGRGGEFHFVYNGLAPRETEVTGSLTISKTQATSSVNDLGDTGFVFTVTFGEENVDLSGIMVPDGATQDSSVSRKYTVTIKKGETATFSNIPNGTTYEVVEAVKSPYSLSGIVDKNITETNTTGSGATCTVDTKMVNGTIDTSDAARRNASFEYQNEKVGTNVDISKINDGGDPLPGATITITGKDSSNKGIVFKTANVTAGTGATIENSSDLDAESGATEITFKTGSTPTTLNNLPDGKYTMHEVTSPDANKYAVARDIDFTISDSKVVAATNVSAATASANGKVTMKDTSLGSLTIKKKLNGAGLANLNDIVFKVTGPNDYERIVTLNNSKVSNSTSGGDFWTASADGYIFTINQLPVDDYTVEETSDGHTSTYTLKSSTAVPANHTVSVARDTANEITFANTYEDVPAPVDVELKASKTYKINEEPQTLTADQFKFTLTKKGETRALQEVGNEADGSVEFNKLTFTGEGTYEYVVAEKAGTESGITYDDKEYAVKVVVSKNTTTNKLEAAVTVDGEADKAMTFTNSKTVETEPVDVELKASKTYKINGDPQTLTADQFKFTLTKKGETRALQEVGNEADGSVEFNKLTFTGEGTYEYVVAEKAGTESGITYDDKEYAVKVVVSKNTTTNKLEAVVTVDGEADKAMTFTNSKTVETEPVDVELKASKTYKINGDPQTLTADQFKFTLTKKGETRALQEVGNEADGSVEFNKLTFTGEGTYEYVVAEKAGTESGITYDDKEYAVKVVVSKNTTTNKLEAAVTVDGEADKAMTFTNSKTVETEPVDVELKASKTYKINGDPQTLTADQFKFTLTKKGETRALQEVGNEADGSVEFNKLTFTGEGTYEYVVAEKTGTESGITYDDKEYAVKVVVSKNTTTNKLEAAVTVDGEADKAMTFTNSKTVETEPVDVELKASKTYKINGDPQTLTADQFKFTLTKKGETRALQEVGNEADGSVEFNKLTFTGEGTYEYVVAEKAGTESGITYDDKEYAVKVVVSKNTTTNKLEAVVTVDGEADKAMTFTNSKTVETEPVDVELKASKTYKINGDPQTLTADQFKFTLTKKGETRALQEVGNEADGSVEFNKLTFTGEGTYEYVVAEKAGTESGITYDDKEYAVKVVVSKNTTTNKLEAAVTVDGAADKAMTFVNTKTTAETEKGYINLTKTIKGAVNEDDLKTMTFTVKKGDDTVAVFKLGEDFVKNTSTGVYELKSDKVLEATIGRDYTVVESMYKNGDKNTEVSVSYNITVGAENPTSGTGATTKDAFSVTTGNTTTVAFKNVYKCAPVKFTKESLFDGEFKKIDGAKLAIYKLDDNNEKASDTPITTWISSETEEYSFTLDAGKYAIEEVEAPNGYAKTDELVKFKLTVDDEGDGTLEKIGDDGPGKVYENTGKIAFYNDPIGILYVHVTVETPNDTEGKETKDVPNAEVEVTDENGDVVGTYKTNEKGEVVDSTTGKYPELTPGKYTVKITKIPDNYEFKDKLDGQESTVEVPQGGQGKHEAVIETLLGGLDIVVVEEDTGRVVPGAKVLVTKPDGTTEECITDDNGMITKFAQKDEFGNYTSPLGKYTYKVTWVQDGYKVTLNEENEGVVKKGELTSLESKINTITGGLKVRVLEEGTNRIVPDATVEIKAPEGTTFPDGSTIITAITNEDGYLTTYKGKDGETYSLVSGLEPGKYQITVTKVPEGYNVTTGKTETVEVVAGKVTPHTAWIAAPATKTTTPATTTTTAKSVDTGDHMNVIPFIILMIVSLISSIVVIIRKRRLRYEY